ncbi:Uncharacterised protein [Bordetella pertussis]|nr:Uncharacterised protein [Bordetella pertussis]CFN98717.1 Uncharacterised protein [Bordetella pertussis]CFU09988.1 Uncharacterised protein [Bordetella pertussis]CFW90416.1 Uncharacterised protein [Bordetella pertussis]CPQ07766.1 Uncharacterised protein [Bordetella pertussis]
MAVGQRRHHGVGHVAHIDRLHARTRAGQRQDGEQARQPREHPGEVVVGTEHHRGPEQRPAARGAEHALDGGLAVALGAQVHAGAAAVGAQRADVQHARHAVAHAGLGNALRQQHVRAGEAGAVGTSAAPMQHAHQVDDRIAPVHEPVQLGVVVHVRFDQGDRGQHLQVPPLVVAARRHQDLVLLRRQARNQMTADEAGSADDKDTHRAAPCSIIVDRPILPCPGRARKGALSRPAGARRPAGRRCRR